MPPTVGTEWPYHLRNIQRITADGAEGVIMIDIHQSIRWANAAALAMHGVASPEELGRTIDEYHANFKVRFRGSQEAPSDEALERVAAGESFRSIIVAVTPLHGQVPKWEYRVRNLVLVDEDGSPTCIVLLLRPISAMADGKSRFFAGIDTLPNAAAILQPGDGRCVDANDAFLRLFGLDRAALDAGTLSASDVLSRFGSDGGLDSGVVSDRPLPPTPSQIQTEQGETRTVLVSTQPVEHVRKCCTLLNVVELLPVAGAAAEDGQASGPIRDAATLCALAPKPVVVLDNTMRIMTASQAWLAWFGLNTHDAVGRPISDVMTAQAAAQFESQTWHRLWQSGAVHDAACELVGRSGAVMDVQLSARLVHDETGVPVMVVIAARDISERRQWRESFATLFALSPVPMLIRKLDDSRILDVNDALIAATGFSADELAGHSIDELTTFENKAQRQSFESAVRAADRVRNLDVKLKTSFGDTLDCVLSAQQVSAFGQTCALLILQDVSDRRRNEQQLFQAIETVMKDSSWFSRSVIEKLAAVRTPPRSGAKPAELSDLTPREQEVLGLISHGMTDVEIAAKLALTRSTVRNHVATLYSKIGVHSRSSAIIWARERGVNFAWPSSPVGAYAKAADQSHKDIGHADGAQEPPRLTWRGFMLVVPRPGSCRASGGRSRRLHARHCRRRNHVALPYLMQLRLSAATGAVFADTRERRSNMVLSRNADQHPKTERLGVMVEPPGKPALIDRRKAVREAVKKLTSADFIRETAASASGARTEEDVPAKRVGTASGDQAGRQRTRN